MAIVNEDTKVKVSGDGSTREFSFGFKIYQKSDLTVYLIDKDTEEIDEKTLTTDYKVSIDTTGEGGTVEFVTLNPPSSDEWVFMFSALDYTQNVVLPTDGAFREKKVSDGLDRIVRLVQQVKEQVDRAIVIPPYDEDDPPDFAELIEVAAEAAQDAAGDAEGYRDEAEGFKDEAEGFKNEADGFKNDAANYALALKATSTSSVEIGTGEKTFSTQADKQFHEGHYTLIVDDDDSSNYMFGRITSYSGTTLVVDVITTDGAGTIDDWDIMVSGARGAKGDPGDGSISSGLDASKDGDPDVGDIYWATDTEKLYWCLNESVWTEVIDVAGIESDISDNADSISTIASDVADNADSISTIASDVADKVDTVDDKASTSEAETATNDTKYMTPKKTKESIDENAPQVAFGSWVSRSAETNYQAETDGFVCVYATTNGGRVGMSDSSSTPTTIRVGNTYSGLEKSGHITMPVRKGDYWRVYNQSNKSTTVWWLPLGT
jgi:hypothetical protein